MNANGQRLTQAIQAAVQRLREHVDEVNAMNLSPTPDLDTGSNMLATLEAGLTEVGWCALRPGYGDTMYDVMAAMAYGALFHAKGGSGVILSQMLRGFARGLSAPVSATAATVARAGYDMALASILLPVKGSNMLSVLAVVADALLILETDVIDALTWATAEAKESVNGDAGSMGLIYLLEGALDYLKGDK